MIDKQRLEEKCSTWNIALTGTQLDQLDAFAQILVDYNQKVNDKINRFFIPINYDIFLIFAQITYHFTI